MTFPQLLPTLHPLYMKLTVLITLLAAIQASVLPIDERVSKAYIPTYASSLPGYNAVTKTFGGMLKVHQALIGFKETLKTAPRKINAGMILTSGVSNLICGAYNGDIMTAASGLAQTISGGTDLYMCYSRNSSSFQSQVDSLKGNFLAISLISEINDADFDRCESQTQAIGEANIKISDVMQQVKDVAVLTDEKIQRMVELLVEEFVVASERSQDISGKLDQVRSLRLQAKGKFDEVINNQFLIEELLNETDTDFEERLKTFQSLLAENIVSVADAMQFHAQASMLFDETLNLINSANDHIAVITTLSIELAMTAREAFKSIPEALKEANAALNESNASVERLEVMLTELRERNAFMGQVAMDGVQKLDDLTLSTIGYRSFLMGRVVGGAIGSPVIGGYIAANMIHKIHKYGFTFYDYLFTPVKQTAPGFADGEYCKIEFDKKSSGFYGRLLGGSSNTVGTAYIKVPSEEEPYKARFDLRNKESMLATDQAAITIKLNELYTAERITLAECRSVIESLLSVYESEKKIYVNLISPKSHLFASTCGYAIKDIDTSELKKAPKYSPAKNAFKQFWNKLIK